MVNKHRLPERQVEPPATRQGQPHPDDSRRTDDAIDCAVCGKSIPAGETPVCKKEACRQAHSPNRPAEIDEREAEQQAERHRETMMENQMERGI
jgi:hypothetical protein